MWGFQNSFGLKDSSNCLKSPLKTNVDTLHGNSLMKHEKVMTLTMLNLPCDKSKVGTADVA